MMKNSLKRFTAVLACTALTAALALPARAAEEQTIRVGSYKGAPRWRWESAAAW